MTRAVADSIATAPPFAVARREAVLELEGAAGVGAAAGLGDPGLAPPGADPPSRSMRRR